MKHYIFVTTEGTTYQPESEASDFDLNVENAQVVGFGEGENLDEAYKDLLKNESWLEGSNFNEVIAYELTAKKVQGYFYIKEDNNNV